MVPRDVYTTRLEARRATADAARAREDRLANVRLLVALGAGLVLWWVVAQDRSLAWLALPVGAFAVAVEGQGRAQRARERAERAAGFYERGVARLDYAFPGRKHPGAPPPETHPYAAHLDLFGDGSLFALLCNAQTAAGRRTLGAWLLEPAAPDEIASRQEAVRELRDRLDLREELATLAAEDVEAVDSDALPDWGERPRGRRLGTARVLAAAAGVVLPLSLVGIALGWPDIVTFAGLLFALAVAAVYARRVQAILESFQRPQRDLPRVIHLLERVESEPFAAERLARVRQRLETGGRPPSAELRRLVRLADTHDWRFNFMFAIPAASVLWGTQWALAIEAWRRRWGGHLRLWLAALGEMEALLDLASHAYEHPEDPFPEIVADADGPFFEGSGLGHPLLPEGDVVRNDLRLDPERPLFVVTGSNMSGKSTLLRTVGVNAILAQAGAPVRATALRMTPLQVAASLRTQDSLTGGASRFYAEITCMRRMIELTEGPLPVLVLLDELLHGTNSHDRRVGASGFVRGLLERGAIGLITTHDLALAELADEHPRVTNAHFECTLRDGRLAFDYTLRPGVVASSNALELMRAVGLDV